MDSSPTVFDVGITTLTNVTAISRIGLDIRDMNEFLKESTPDFLNAKRIYDEGKYSPQYDKNGNELEDLLTLKSMSVAAFDGLFNEDPTFMFQMLGMMNVGQVVEDVIERHSGYANEFVFEKLNDDTSGNLAAQAAVVLTVESYAIHQLWDGVLDCVEISNGFNPDADYTRSINPRQSFDNFIALYVGAEQKGAPDFDGNMLYSLAHQAAKMFGTLNEVGEAKVNEDIRNQYQSIQQLMSEEKYCTREDALEQLWLLVNQIVAKMHVPLVQYLIYVMKEEDQVEKVDMYAKAVIPQLSQCRPSIQRKLKSYLLDKRYDRKDFDRIVSLLQESYDCLGFTCADVGAYNGADVAECAGYETTHPMAGFFPVEHVRSVSKLDLDVFAIQELLRFPSKTNNVAALMYYRFGRSALIDDDRFSYNTLSLREMTQATHRKEYSPYYHEFVDYHKNQNYADSQIIVAFEDSKMPAANRNAYILSWIQYSVIPEYMMAVLAISHTECGREGLGIDARRALQGDVKSPVFFWDAFAAFYIGSMEGVEVGGSDETVDGIMLWNLANKRAVTFNTLNDEFYAEINDKMVELLFAGQSELDRSNCLNIEKSANQVMHLMLMPIIQNNIWYAIQNQDLPANSTSPDLVVGKVLALSVLPIVSKYDKDAAAVIERNMVDIENHKPVQDGAQAVADAFYQVLDDMEWGCKYLGEAEGVGTCQSSALTRNDASAVTSIVATTVFGLLFSVVLLWY